MSVSTTCRDIKELLPNAQIACNLFLAECKKQGLNVLITETYRSQERQDYLYSQGRTRKGKKVTWTRNSRHTSRRAWDICKNVKGQEYSDTNFFKKCGKIAEALNITWGGSWKNNIDLPHFEVSCTWSVDNLPSNVDKQEVKKVIYNSIHEVPEAYKATIEKLINKGILKGTGNGLNLSEDMCRILVILDRTNIFN